MPSIVSMRWETSTVRGQRRELLRREDMGGKSQLMERCIGPGSASGLHGWASICSAPEYSASKTLAVSHGDPSFPQLGCVPSPFKLLGEQEASGEGCHLPTLLSCSLLNRLSKILPFGFSRALFGRNGEKNLPNINHVFFIFLQREL